MSMRSSGAFGGGSMLQRAAGTAAPPPADAPAASLNKFRDDIYHREVTTSLHLQLLLYFGGYFKCFFAVTIILTGWYKSRWIDYDIE